MTSINTNMEEYIAEEIIEKELQVMNKLLDDLAKKRKWGIKWLKLGLIKS